MNDQSLQTELTRERFDKEAGDYWDNYRHSSKQHSFLMRRKRVSELLETVHSGKLLDIGCGPGITFDMVREKGFDFFGVDFSQPMIDYCLET
ncbi:MAG: methyltransferase domain-containing protein, partial [Planctomycetales bacterium]